MLYRLHHTDTGVDSLEALPFQDFSSFGQLEKDLENLIADNILEVLFEDAGLLPVFQERPYQSEADLYALNKAGELTIFELKRGLAGADAVHQVLRYAQTAGQWTYAELDQRYRQYSGNTAELHLAHQEAFDLEHPLRPQDINARQRLIVIGSAADEDLINAVDYWRRQGLDINFLPYRVYEVAGEHYLEFFAPPYDRHKNPADTKGVIFDTNRTYDEDAVWYMLENERVAAFGDAKRYVNYLNPGDIVFFSHRWVGLVAAARVKNGPAKAPDPETLYRDVEFLTPVPTRGSEWRAMPFRAVAETTGKGFFWARTIKVPYLTRDEADSLVAALNTYLQGNS